MPAIRRLKTADNVRAALAWVFRQVENDTIDPSKARVMIYACATMANIITSADLEARLEALEQQAKEEAEL